MKTKQEFELDNEFLGIFKNVYHFKYASIYSKEPIEDWEFNDCSEEIEEEEIEKDNVGKTRIGVVSYDEDDIDIIIIIKKPTKVYGEFWTTDSIFYLEVDDNKHYVPAQEPVDCIDDWENGGGSRLEESDKLETLSKLYDLDVCLIGV